MKFRYYITDTLEGLIVGTNDSVYALAAASSEDYFVVDSETGEWLTSSGKALPVELRND